MSADQYVANYEVVDEQPAQVAQRKEFNPNFLLVLIMLIMTMALVVLVYDRYFSERAQATIEQVAPAIAPPGPHPGAVRVEDAHCASGQGWQWTESVPDGQGGENNIIKGSC